jgi:hypothetical protein
MARQYMAKVRRYPCHDKYVRFHLFKILYQRYRVILILATELRRSFLLHPHSINRYFVSGSTSTRQFEIN